MGEEASHELTRPPDERDLLVLARELNRLQARYIVIGGVAMNRLGHIRATEDLDLLIARDRENQDRVREALEILPDKASGNSEPTRIFPLGSWCASMTRSPWT